MPRCRAAARSTWSVPIQKQPIAVSLPAFSSIEGVNRVRERIPRKWQSPILSASSSWGSAEGTLSTWL
jgi:hypothetical protein